MKPKKKVRKSGYYVAIFKGAREKIIIKYCPSNYPQIEVFNSLFVYTEDDFSYISPTHITLRSKTKKDITIPVTRSGHGKPKPRKK